MSLEITGKLLVKYDTQVVSDRFKKREFVLELVDETPNGNFTNYAKMQLVQNKTDLLDRFKEGDNVRASFNIKGSRYDKNGTVSYFTNLDVWRIEPAEAGSNGGQNAGYEGAAPTGGYNSGSNYSNSNSNAANSSFSASPAQEADDLPF